MKANPGKYHLLINNTKESFQIKIVNETVSNSEYEKLLGVKEDWFWSKKIGFELFHKIAFLLLSDSMDVS